MEAFFLLKTLLRGGCIRLCNAYLSLMITVFLNNVGWGWGGGLLTASLTKCVLGNISTDIIKCTYKPIYVEPCA